MTESVTQSEELVQSLIDRVLNLRCADTASPLYGSFDRDFWLYRTIRGFQSAPFQHVMAGFAYLSQSASHTGTHDYVEIAEAALAQWIKQRNRNGSANEWYRNEQSFCATAMGLHAATETVLTFSQLSNPRCLNHHLESLMPSVQWLSKRRNPLAANQDIASITGRWNLGALLSDRSIQVASERSMKELIEQFDRSGYLSEYGGLDIGYSLLSLDLLVSSHSAGFEQASRLAARISGVLHKVVSKGGDFPFALGSRGTHHPFYAGVHYFSSFVPEATELLKQLNERHVSQQVEHISRYDDRYLMTFGFTALARLLVFEATQEPRPLTQILSVTAKPEPLLERIDLANGTLFCNRDLGSALQFLADSHESFVHLGYAMTVGDERWCSLSGPAGDSTEVSHPFIKQSTSVPLERFQLAFSLLEVLCRVPWIASRVSWWARVRLGRSMSARSAHFYRRIRVTETTVLVEDEVRVQDLTQPSVVESLDTFPFHSPSRFLGIQVSLSDYLTTRSWATATLGSTVIKWQLEVTPTHENIKVSEV